MAKELDTTHNRATRLKLAGSEARGAHSLFNSTTLTLYNLGLWRILTQKSIHRWMVIQMGFNIGVTRLVVSLSILMNNFCQKLKIGG